MTITRPGVKDLIGALVGFVRDWQCDEISAVYVLDGRPLRLHVTRLLTGDVFAMIEAEDGSTIAVPQELLP
jgi:hypothetical protein